MTPAFGGHVTQPASEAHAVPRATEGRGGVLGRAAGMAASGSAVSEALAPYAAAFCSPEAAAETSPFLTYLCKGKAGGIEKTEFTRSQLWALVKTAAGVLKAHGLTKGDCVTHYFNENR